MPPAAGRLVDMITNVAFVSACLAASWYFVSQAATPSVSVQQATEPTGGVGALLPMGDNTLGQPRAPLGLLVYSDFQCPFCAQFTRRVYPELKQRYVDPGQLQIAFRHAPLVALHPFAARIAVASVCAGEQGNFWPMHDALFAKDVDPTDSYLIELAGRVGSDRDRLRHCLAEPLAAAVVGQHAAEAADYGILGTPTFLLGRVQSDGLLKVEQRINGARPQADFHAAIDALLR
jgi:protein-disulfide isomerase